MLVQNVFRAPAESRESLPASKTVPDNTLLRSRPERGAPPFSYAALGAGFSTGVFTSRAWRVRGPKMASIIAPNSQVPAMKKKTLW